MGVVKQATIKNTRKLEEANKGASVVLAMGEILDLAAGLAVPATSSSTRATVIGVCNQTIAAAEALTRVPYIVASDEDTFIFPTTNNSDATHNGQDMILGASSSIVNNTGSTSAVGVVRQVEPYGDPSDKLIIGKFITV
jgi:predicted RecA/RadA family phage recombinase